MSELESQDEEYEEEEERPEVGYCPQCGVWADDLTVGCSNCGYRRANADENEVT